MMKYEYHIEVHLNHRCHHRIRANVFIVTICLQCGDKGFSNAFVYCVNCLNLAVHRYCMEEIPKTFDELVYWVCDDCAIGLSRISSTLEPKVTNFEERDHINSNDLKNQRTIGVSNGKLRKPLLPYRNKKKKRALVAKGKFRSRLERIDEVDEDAERSSSLLAIKLKEKESRAWRPENTDNGIQSAETHAELELTKTMNKESISENFEGKQNKAKYSSPNTLEQGSKNCSEICQQGQAHLENSSTLTTVEHAKPSAMPIWRGGFFILNKDYDAFDGLAAHLSTRICSKAYEEAKLFPSLLDLEMHSKADVWPKSFEKSDPPDDNIALYFFSHNQRYEELFDQLVSDMMSGELALKATLQNAELLIFTSNELPIGYWKFQGKFYLWGVFRAKKARSSS